jgi:hypothetical protein
MALIRSLELDKQPARPPRTEVDCLYTIVHTDAGARLLRLATLGSDHRKLHPKPSQIIELDRVMAEKLLGVILDTFPGLRSDKGPPNS